jgi:hypothetical protein
MSTMRRWKSAASSSSTAPNRNGMSARAPSRSAPVSAMKRALFAVSAIWAVMLAVAAYPILYAFWLSLQKADLRRPDRGARLYRELAGADVLDFPADCSAEPHVRDTAAVRVTDLAAVFVRPGSHLGRDPAGPKPLSHLDCDSSGLLVVDRDQYGFLYTGADAASCPSWNLTRSPHPHETSIPGLFAVGDVRSGSVKRVASAVGEGSVVVSEIHQFLATPQR